MPQSDYPVVSALPWEGDGGGGGGAGSTWPLKRVAELAGDVVIGGLHMIHERNARMTCGPIMPQGGVQEGACRRDRGAGNARSSRSLDSHFCSALYVDWQPPFHVPLPLPQHF